MLFRSISKLQCRTGIILTHVHCFLDSAVVSIGLVQLQEVFLQMSETEHVWFHVGYSKGCFLQVLPTGELTIVNVINNYLINTEETQNTSQS